MSEHRKKWNYSLVYWPWELAEDLLLTMLRALSVLSGSKLPPGPERGFRRLVLPVSVGIFILTFYFRQPLLNERFSAALAGRSASPNERVALLGYSMIPDLAISAAFAAVPWAIFFLVRWIVRGFRD